MLVCSSRKLCSHQAFRGQRCDGQSDSRAHPQIFVSGNSTSLKRLFQMSLSSSCFLLSTHFQSSLHFAFERSLHYLVDNTCQLFVNDLSNIFWHFCTLMSCMILIYVIVRAWHSERDMLSKMKLSLWQDCYAVCRGGPEETKALLQNRFDHIFYTGKTLQDGSDHCMSLRFCWTDHNIRDLSSVSECLLAQVHVQVI